MKKHGIRIAVPMNVVERAFEPSDGVVIIVDVLENVCLANALESALNPKISWRRLSRH